MQQLQSSHDYLHLGVTVTDVTLCRMEECDCWYANPTWDTETAVIAGKKTGTMYGIISAAEKPSAAQTFGRSEHQARAQANLLRSFPQAE